MQSRVPLGPGKFHVVVLVSPSTQNLTISRRSCVRTAEKYTKNRAESAAGAVVLLTEVCCVLDVLVAVAVVVS